MNSLNIEDVKLAGKPKDKPVLDLKKTVRSHHLQPLRPH